MVDAVYSLTFRLEVNDGWPPVAAEGLPCEKDKEKYRVLSPPLFIKGLSVGDVIEITETDHDQVYAWKHIVKSGRSTVWVMLLGSSNIEDCISQLKEMGCNVERFLDHRLLSIDIPEAVRREAVDLCLSSLNPEEVAVAYPSWRHE